MTNSYDVDHGLSQDAPGPLGLEAPDDTPARTGNTARDQEMYAAGRAVGEENAKHNAAIRAGVPDGWKLVPAAMTLDMCVAFAEAWFSKVRCIDDPEMQDAYTAMLNAAPAAGGALTDATPEWATCESRGPWARNSLKAVIDLLRGKETRARHAFTKDYMGLPARYIADAYGEAAAVIERKLEAIAAQRQGDA